MAKNKQKNQSGAACPARKTSIGGQALMEGIMMRGPETTAMAVRNTSGEIVIESFPTTTKKRPGILKLPIIRGVVGFIDSMTLGYKCLMRSAEISGFEELEEEMAREKAQKKAEKKAQKAAKKQKGEVTNKKPSDVSHTQNNTVETSADTTPDTVGADSISARNTDIPTPENPTDPENAVGEGLAPPESPTYTAEDLEKAKKSSSATTGLVMVVSVVIAVAVMLGLFFFLPSFLYRLMADHIPHFPDNRFLQSIFESMVRILLMVGYMGLMCLMKDTRRTFQFHGAEHKTIFCYEHGMELTVENVRHDRRFHPRCGTSFLMLMLLVGIIIGFFIPAGLPTLLRVVIKLLLMPLTMGLGYELIKICGRYDNWLTRIIAAPGLAFQHITVLEPDDSMIECAITAIKQVIPNDGSDLY